jgi:hypothetical protein
VLSYLEGVKTNKIKVHVPNKLLSTSKGDATTSTIVQGSTIFTINVQLSTIIVTIKKTVTIIVDNCTLIVKMVDSCTIVLVVASPLSTS